VAVHNWVGDSAGYLVVPVEANWVGVECLELENIRVCQSGQSRWLGRPLLGLVIALVLCGQARLLGHEWVERVYFQWFGRSSDYCG
jgi:hypothetical protein